LTTTETKIRTADESLRKKSNYVCKESVGHDFIKAEIGGTKNQPSKSSVNMSDEEKNHKNTAWSTPLQVYLYDFDFL